MSDVRKVILFPSAAPEYFMVTPNQDWRVKRGWLADTGVRIYTIEHWDKGKLKERILYPSKFFVRLLWKLEKLLGKKINLYQEFSGQLVKVCGQNGIPADDTRTYPEYLSDMGVNNAKAA